MMERKVYTVLKYIHYSDWTAYRVHKVFIDKQKAEDACMLLNCQDFQKTAKEEGIEKAFIHSSNYYYTNEIVNQQIRYLRRKDIDVENLTLEDFERMQKILIANNKEDFEPFRQEIGFYRIEEIKIIQ